MVSIYIYGCLFVVCNPPMCAKTAWNGPVHCIQFWRRAGANAATQWPSSRQHNVLQHIWWSLILSAQTCMLLLLLRVATVGERTCMRWPTWILYLFIFTLFFIQTGQPRLATSLLGSFFVKRSVTPGSCAHIPNKTVFDDVFRGGIGSRLGIGTQYRDSANFV